MASNKEKASTSKISRGHKKQMPHRLPPSSSTDEIGEDEKPSSSQPHNDKRNNSKKGGKLILPRITSEKTARQNNYTENAHAPRWATIFKMLQDKRGSTPLHKESGTIVKRIIAFTPDPGTFTKTDKNCIRKQLASNEQQEKPDRSNLPNMVQIGTVNKTWIRASNNRLQQ